MHNQPFTAHSRGRPLYVLAQLLLLLVSSVRSVLEKLLDKVDVGHDHTSAAVSLETELVHSVAIGLAGICDQLKVAFPKVSSDLSTGEATDGDNHFGGVLRMRGFVGYVKKDLRQEKEARYKQRLP
jgi:hypothetical protein